MLAHLKMARTPCTASACFSCPCVPSLSVLVVMLITLLYQGEDEAKVVGGLEVQFIDNHTTIVLSLLYWFDEKRISRDMLDRRIYSSHTNCLFEAIMQCYEDIITLWSENIKKSSIFEEIWRPINTSLTKVQGGVEVWCHDLVIRIFRLLIC